MYKYLYTSLDNYTMYIICLNTMDYVFTYNSHPAIRFCFYDNKKEKTPTASFNIRIYRLNYITYISWKHVLILTFYIRDNLINKKNNNKVSDEACNFVRCLHKRGLVEH